MAFECEGMADAAEYTGYGIRVNKIRAFEPKTGNVYLRCKVYRGKSTKGEEILSSKRSAKYYCQWPSKAEAEKPESIQQFLEKLKPASRKRKKKGGVAPLNKRKQTPPKQNGAPASEQVPRTSSKGVDILDLLAQIKANELTGGDTELVYSGALLQAMKVGTRKRRKQVGRFGTRRKERQTNEGKTELQADRLEWRKIQIELFLAFMHRSDMECIVDKDGAPCAAIGCWGVGSCRKRRSKSRQKSKRGTGTCSISAAPGSGRCWPSISPTQAQPAPNKKTRIARNAKTAPIDSSRRASLQPSSVFFGAAPGLARGLSEM